MKTSNTITCSHVETTNQHITKRNVIMPNATTGHRTFFLKKKKEKELSNTLHKDLTCITFVYITCKY